MVFDEDRNRGAFLRAEAAYLAPPEPRECECFEGDDDPCPKCAVEMYDEDYMKDPDRARDERIDMEMERGGDCYD